MKKIHIFCVSNLELKTKLHSYITNENKNSLIRLDEKELNIYGSVLQYDEILVLELKEILKNSFYQVDKISEEDHGPFNEKIIYSPIENYINLCSYDSNQPKSIFHFVANLFYKYLSGHLMNNGNKRLSFLFMINILYYFGFCFFYSKETSINYKKYEGEIEKWVEKSQNMHSKEYDLESYIDDLAEWIKKNSVVTLK